MHRLREIRRLSQLQRLWVSPDLLLHRMQGHRAIRRQALHPLQRAGRVPPNSGEVPCVQRGLFFQAKREGFPPRNPRWDQRAQRAPVPRAGELRPDAAGLRGPCGEGPRGPPRRVPEGGGQPFDGCEAVPPGRAVRVLAKYSPFERE